jgi:hypothetical protein
MGLPETLWDKIRRGEFPQTDAAIAEVLCSVGRQLAFRLDKLIDIWEHPPEEPEAPLYGPGGAYTPIGRLVELMRLDLASYPRNHAVVVVTNAGVSMIANPLPYSIPVMVTNLDNAQFLYYGSPPAAINTSPIIDPEQSMKILVSPESDLYGIVAGADINVAISNLDLPTI